MGSLLVIYVNFNSAADLLESIRSVRADWPGAVIRVLDNGSSEADARLLRQDQQTGGQYTISFSEENLGFGRGVNRAIAAAAPRDDDFVWILNPDTLVRPGCTAALLEQLAQNPDAILSPLIMTGPAAQERIWFAGGEVDLRRGRTTHWHFGSPLAVVESATPYPSPFISGAAPMMTGATWRLLGGFREDLFLYWEDADLSIRADSAGIPGTLVPAALLWHREGGSSDSIGLSPAYYFHMNRNRLLVCRSHASVLSLLFAAGFTTTVRGIAKPLFRESDAQLRKSWAAVRGLVAGLAR